ncbi:unnamed protein product [Ilex paraguariensis]|uniref:LOB domain-containing protein n=1 Tax=Ilex paraguariensis TaxID=185542 RepID=A0ABC8URD9_9AQUA
MACTRCAACKYLRRKCPSDCIFSPYFPANNPQRFASVHRIYGASNIGKMLQQLHVHLRAEAADTLHYEAQCRIQDPVYGCVRIITQLHQQIHNAQSQLAKTQAEIVFFTAQAHEELQEAASTFNTLLPQQSDFGQSFYGSSTPPFY